MAQWTNFEQIKRFVNPTQLYITCEKSGDLHLVEPEVGWQTKFGQGVSVLYTYDPFMTNCRKMMY